MAISVRNVTCEHCGGIAIASCHEVILGDGTVNRGPEDVECTNPDCPSKAGQ